MRNIFELDFYQKEDGKIPVKDFLCSLEPKLRAKAFRDIELLRNFGNDLREPYVKPIKGENNKGLYELRVKFQAILQEYSILHIIIINMCCYMDL